VSRYAAQTEVSADRSRGEIESTLQRYGADQFMYGWQEDKAMVQFRAHGRMIRFVLDMPERDDPEFLYTPSRGNERTEIAAYKAWEQATRQRWRALNLVIKAKLEAVESGISEFEAEFLANIVLPNGTTVGGWMLPQISVIYETGDMPKMLEMGND
jgi:hypothetical protein